LCTISLVSAALPVIAGEWSLQNGPNLQNDTAIISVAAPIDTKAVAFGMEPDGQGGSRPLWFRTSDGQKWDKEPASLGQDMLILSHIACPSDTRCWAVGMSINMQTMAFKNVLMGSIKGGDSWYLPPPLTHAVSRIAARGPEDAFLVAGSVVIPIETSKVKTAFVPKVDGEPFNGINDAGFVGDDVIFLVNGESEENEETGVVTILPRGALLRSNDGGDTWTALYKDREEDPERVCFITDKIGFIMGSTPSGPFLRRTDDGGGTWMDITLPTPAERLSRAFFPTGRCSIPKPVCF